MGLRLAEVLEVGVLLREFAPDHRAEQREQKRHEALRADIKRAEELRPAVGFGERECSGDVHALAADLKLEAFGSFERRYRHLLVPGIC